MTLRFLKLCFITTGALLVIHLGTPTLAKDMAKNVEVFVDLDGDGFDDNESDVNKDGVPDLVFPVELPKTLASASDIFSGTSYPAVKAAKMTNAQRFGLRTFSTRAQCVNRSGLKNGFPDEQGTGTAAGSAACPGGVCGI